MGSTSDADSQNDSVYSLVRESALGADDGARAMKILASGATLQGLAAFAVVQIAVWIGML